MSPEASAACQEVLGRISAYLDGDLPAPACQDIDAHCRECTDCGALVAGLRRTIGLCQQAGRAPLPAAVRRRAQESVRRLIAARTPARPASADRKTRVPGLQPRPTKRGK